MKKFCNYKLILFPLALVLFLSSCQLNLKMGISSTPTPKPSDQYMPYFNYVASLNSDFETYTVEELNTIAEEIVALDSPDSFSELNLQFSDSILDMILKYQAYVIALNKDAIAGGGVTASFAKVEYSTAKLQVTLYYREWEEDATNYLAQYGEVLP